ncbi:MAG: thermonuclease family protein [Desulfobulbaceae bacterium]|nr:thermonuclease family protein [Desulfobulbaceae bacterium]
MVTKPPTSRFLPFYPLLFAILLIVSLPALVFALEGKVVNVADGDTITILTADKQQIKIRLYGIDCPENGQAFGNVAKKFTAKMVAGKHVSVTPYDTDRYGRTVGVVTVNGKNVNESIIAAGYGWQYRKYCKESFCNQWLTIEQMARSSGIGLWVDKKPLPPWEHRRGGATSTKQTGVSAQAPGAYHGNVRSMVFHGPNCKHYNCKNCVKQFESREAAIRAGYRPCGNCKPQSKMYGQSSGSEP